MQLDHISHISPHRSKHKIFAAQASLDWVALHRTDGSVSVFKTPQEVEVINATEHARAIKIAREYLNGNRIANIAHK